MEDSFIMYAASLSVSFIIIFPGLKLFNIIIPSSSVVKSPISSPSSYLILNTTPSIGSSVSESFFIILNSLLFESTKQLKEPVPSSYFSTDNR